MMSKICSKCGAQIPFGNQCNIIQPWKWENLCAVLVDNIPKPKCLHCKHELKLPYATVLFLPNLSSVFMVFNESPDDSFIQQIKTSFRSKNEKETSSLSFKVLSSLDDLRLVINQHVLAYKPFLKELSKAQLTPEGLPKFVSEHWRELTPTVLAAGLVGFTGLIPNIGGEVIDPKTGQRVEITFEDKLKDAQAFFAQVQCLVWLNILSANSMPPDFTLENALHEHVLSGGVYGNNLEILSDILVRMRGDNKFPQLAWYTGQALLASICHEENLPNSFGSAWAWAYFSFEELLAKEGAVEPSLAAWRISAQRASSTITEKDAWDVIAHRVNDSIGENFSQDLMATLNLIAERIGYKDLAYRVAASMKISSKEGSLFGLLCKVIDDTNNVEGWPKSALNLLSGSLIQTADIELIEKVYNYVWKQISPNGISPNDDQQAGLEAWYGMCAKELRQPKRFIDLVGEQPRNWEYQLSLERQLDLWNERANAFRLLGKSHDALALTEDMLKLVKNKDDFASNRYVLLRNRGILLRETGALDASYRQLKELIGNCSIEGRASLFESYAATCTLLGRYEEAVDILLQAIEWGKENKQKLIGLLASAYSLAGRNNDAIRELAKLKEESLSEMELIVLTSAYLNLLSHGENLDDQGQRHLAQSFGQLSKLAEKAEGNGDFHTLEQLLTMLGNVADTANAEVSDVIWQKLLSISREHGRYPSPIALAHLASLAYLRDSREEAFPLLLELPRALIGSYGVISDLSIAFNATRAIRPILASLMGAALTTNAPWSDIRLIAELRRDTIGKAQLMLQRRSSSIDVELLEAGITDEALAKMAPSRGRLGILEWIDYGSHNFITLTIIDDNGAVDVVVMQPPQFNIFELCFRIVNKLSVWHVGRKGSPFDIPDWNMFEQWLHTEIAQHIPNGGHVVVISHADLSGLPWHVALAPNWRCSYASGWTTMLGVSNTCAFEIKYPRIGVFAAPRYHDVDAIRAAISDAVDSTRNWTSINGYKCDIYENEHADRNAFERLMAECDIVELFCHGYADPDDLEIALLVSSHGALSPIHAPSKTSVSDAHRLSWRDLQALKRTPPLVLSAACSTGIQWQAGAGEQMGLLGAMRKGGTKTLIAPRWDVVATDVLPLLTLLLEKRFNQNTALIDALHETCIEAEKHMPRWLAWSLALEGDWS